MEIFSRRKIPVIAMVAAAGAIFIAGNIFRMAPLVIAIGVVAVLFGALYAWKRSQRKVPREKGFWIVLKAGLIFAGGAIYGAAQSLREGSQWVDLLSLIVPAGIAGALIWYSFRLRRAARSSTPPEPTP